MHITSMLKKTHAQCVYVYVNVTIIIKEVKKIIKEVTRYLIGWIWEE